VPVGDGDTAGYRSAPCPLKAIFPGLTWCPSVRSGCRPATTANGKLDRLACRPDRPRCREEDRVGGNSGKGASGSCGAWPALSASMRLERTMILRDWAEIRVAVRTARGDRGGNSVSPCRCRCLIGGRGHRWRGLAGRLRNQLDVSQSRRMRHPVARARDRSGQLRWAQSAAADLVSATGSLSDVGGRTRGNTRRRPAVVGMLWG